MPTPDTHSIEALVSHCREVRIITDTYPQLKPVALELLQMTGPLPRFEHIEKPARGRRKMGAAQRRATSLRMKRYWAARKKEQKNKA